MAHGQPTVKASLSKTAYTQVNVGANPALLQARFNRVRIVFADSEPSAATDAYHMLSPHDGFLVWPHTEGGIWAMAEGSNSALILTEGA